MPSENIKLSRPAATSENSGMYDIYLSSEYHTLPNLSVLTEKAPVYLQATWYKLTQILAQKLVPGFMKLNLPADLAAELLECIEIAGGHGLVVPIGYRQPKVTVEMAYAIAEQEIARKQALHPNYKFEPTKFFGAGVMWWEFGAISNELGRAGHIPNAIRASVDKLDGHTWTSAEQLHHLYGEEYYLESATSLEPMEVLKLVSAQLGLEWSTDHKHNNKPCLKGPALVVGAVKNPSLAKYIHKKYGFRPTIHMWFRMNRYKKGYEAARPLMMRIVELVLKHDPADAVLVFDDSSIVNVLQRISGQLIIDEKWSSWIGPRLYL